MWQRVYNLIKNKYFLSLAGNVIMSGLGLITMTLIYRALSPSDAGTWVFFQSILLLIDTFRSGFLTTAFIKFYAGADKERTAEVAGSAWYLGIGVTFMLVLVSVSSLFFLGNIHDEGLVLFFKWSGLYYAFSLPWFLGTCVIQGDQHFGKLLYIRLCNQGSFIVFIILLIIIGKISLPNVLFAYLFSNLITSIYALVKGWTRIADLRKRTKASVKEIYNFGKYSVGTALSANMFNTSDTFIINFVLGKPALAIYNLGQTLMQLVEIPLRSFAVTAMPELAVAYNQNNREGVIQIMKKYAGMLSVLLIPAAIIGCALADLPIYIIGGGRYAGTEAANVFRLFLTFAIIFPPDRFFALTLDVIHQPKVNFYKVLVMLAVNIGADLAGVYLTHSVYGIAFATVLPISTGAIIGYWALNKYKAFSFWNIFKVGYDESLVLLKQITRKRKLQN
ncbi:lipopolysaccharide biosynthesis protein [Mucilaginibacter sp. UR6-11]|uniref:lipopolysaccharide biosynthesis protein n=1 Tax=Mucilaginibacter sp. UR6-11 TaxID=1435644 RepID=UPI001E4E2B46|nr:lipopolysaccharide biosynthesis protein [Mucilaginibacter sp. UR6-11]MCC8423764.1 lipopolysaccharide biosynthesis protein [Mucilaginibacter sp. UR6-11]